MALLRDQEGGAAAGGDGSGGSGGAKSANGSDTSAPASGDRLEADRVESLGLGGSWARSTGSVGDAGNVRTARLATETPLWTLKAYQFLGTAAWACSFRIIGVYYIHVGLTRSQIGWITLCRRCASFCGMLFWARLCDYLGEYRRVLLTCNALGLMTTLCNLLPAVQCSVPLVFAVVIGGTFLNSATSAGVVDALCNRVLEQQGGRETYGNQRLWSCLAAAIFAFVAGALVDLFGVSAMFLGGGFFAALNLTVMCRHLPDADSEAAAQLHQRRQQRRFARSWCRFDVLWFFANLVVYGVCMALVEGFLFVYLLQDFEATSKVVGAAVTVMCTFEIPVFRWFHYFAGGDSPRLGLRTILVCCHAIFALRCLLYAALPPNCPWLVLPVEPLHGLTFAAMWNAAVMYGRSLAAPGQEATMQAFVAGLYYQLADGLGSIAWGPLSEEPPRGLGFKSCWLLDACVVASWSLLWCVGWRLRDGGRPHRCLR